MYHLIHSFTVSQLFKRQLPMFALAFIIAELFYKFHSFTLECVAFLASWYVLDAIVERFFPVSTSAGDTRGTGHTPRFQS